LIKKSDGFQIIEYIRSSIEIIMNLKVEDLEREIRSRTNRLDNHPQDSQSEMSSVLQSVRSINP